MLVTLLRHVVLLKKNILAVVDSALLGQSADGIEQAQNAFAILEAPREKAGLGHALLLLN